MDRKSLGAAVSQEFELVLDMRDATPIVFVQKMALLRGGGRSGDGPTKPAVTHGALAVLGILIEAKLKEERHAIVVKTPWRRWKAQKSAANVLEAVKDIAHKFSEQEDVELQRRAVQLHKWIVHTGEEFRLDLSIDEVALIESDGGVWVSARAVPKLGRVDGLAGNCLVGPTKEVVPIHREAVLPDLKYRSQFTPGGLLQMEFTGWCEDPAWPKGLAKASLYMFADLFEKGVDFPYSGIDYVRLQEPLNLFCDPRDEEFIAGKMKEILLSLMSDGDREVTWREYPQTEGSLLEIRKQRKQRKQ